MFKPAVVTLSNSGETVHIHADRSAVSRLAVAVEAIRTRTTNGRLHPELQDILDALDRVLTAEPAPASVTNRPLTPYFPEGPK